MLHCRPLQTNFFTYFKGLSQDVSRSINFRPFFIGFILKAGIIEASKSWRETDAWWGWHRWNTVHFSPDKHTTLFPTYLKCDNWVYLTFIMWLFWVNKRLLNLESVYRISLPLMMSQMTWENNNETDHVLMKLAHMINLILWKTMIKFKQLDTSVEMTLN